MSSLKNVSFVYDISQDIGKFDFVPVIELTEKEKKREKEGIGKDPDFHCEYIKKKEILTPDFKTEEILETIDRCPICNWEFESMTLSNEAFKQNLSTYLDKDKQNALKFFIILHRRGEFEITFNVKKGRIKANDPDGYIETKIAPNSLGIEILSSVKIETAYNEQITVKLKVKDEKNNDGSWKFFATEVFQLNFFATDNNEDSFWDWQGEAKGSVHCGQFVIVSRNCLCEEWPAAEIRSVIPLDKFVKYRDERDCMKASKKQLSKVGFRLKKGWYDPNDDSIYQIFKDADSDSINDLSSDYKKQRFEKGIKYLIKALSDNTPVIVGLDYMDGDTGNGDETTDHWVVIVGLGKNSYGCFFYYFENVDYNDGTSPKYKFYCDCKKYELRTASGNHVTCIRESESTK